MRKFLFVLAPLVLALTILGGKVSAQGLNREHGEHLKYIQAEDIDMLFELLEDEDVTAELKAKGVARIGTIYRERPKALDKNADEIFNIIISVRDAAKKQPSKAEDDLRSECALTLGIFAKTPKASQAISELRGSLMDDPNYRVNSSSAHILREFTENSSAANKVLIEKLNVFLKQSILKEDDVRLTYTILSSMGTLGEKRSFISLMRVLQSGYPVYVKKAAEEAIGSIDWER